MPDRTLGQMWRHLQTLLLPVDPAPHEGRRLVAHVLGLAEAALPLHEHTTFPAEKEKALEALVARRLTGAPLAYVLGIAPFWTRDWQVREGVLIPRPDTETLLQAVLDVIPPARATRVAEIGVGSGAVVGSLLLERPLATAVGTDTSPTAVAVAGENLRLAGVNDRARLMETSLLEGVEGPFDVIFSNPPYIGEADYAALEASVRAFEPAEALVAGDDGLDVYRSLMPSAAAKLAPGGWLMVEIGWQQGDAVTALFRQQGLQQVRVLPDLAGRDRVVVGRG